MGPQNNNFIIILLSCSSFFFTANANEYLELDYGPDDENSYSYVIGAPNGPNNWSKLNPGWTSCGTGRNQSPINILKFTISPRGDLIRNYKPSPAQIKNKGHTIEVEWTGDAGGIVINGIAFELEQCHWHIPSEHTINGKKFDMELHIVHFSAKRDIAVVGILYTLGAPDPFLNRLAPFIPSAIHNGTNLGIINPSNIGFQGDGYFRYSGSLTTPPCSENVVWSILKNVRTVSSQQITALKNAVDTGITGNARPTQALNGRPVFLFEH